MSRYIATRAIRGANALVTEAEFMLQKALAEKGPDTPVEFPNTAYYLPFILAMTAQEVSTIGQLQPLINHARELLHPQPSENKWTPYLGETLDSGMATLIAAEIIEAIRFVYGLQPEKMPGLELAGGTSYSDNGDGLVGHLNGPIDDIQLRSWGIQLVDGRMPGFAAIVGAAKSNEVSCQDRARAPEAQHPDLPVRQRQRAQHHPPVNGRGCRVRFRHLHRSVWHRYAQRHIPLRFRGKVRADFRRDRGRKSA